MKIFSRIINWYFSKRALPYWSILLLDCLICFVAGLLVMWMYYRAPMTLHNLSIMMRAIALYMIFNIISFRVFHTYSGIIRYSSFADMRRIGLAMLLACALALAAHYPINIYLPGNFVHLAGRQIVAIYSVSTVVMWASRILIKSVYEVSLASSSMKNVFIYGTNTAGM